MLVETVGAGQAEVSIMRVADTVALVLHPGAGDEIQALKAGLMEIADVFVLNKADRPGIRELRSQVASSINLGKAVEWDPPIVETIASRGAGVDSLVEALAVHRAFLTEGEAGADRAAAGARAEASRLARATLAAAIVAEQDGVFAQLDAGTLSEADAGHELARRAARRVVES